MKFNKRYLDKKTGLTITELISGDCYIARNENEMIVTILGSCISACIRDPVLKIGGMNHFLLPYIENSCELNDDDLTALRYGSYSMEILINQLLEKGAKKSFLEVKLFGGAELIKNCTKIGAKNINFVKEYLKNEKLNIISEDLGGVSARRIHYYPTTGQAMVRKAGNKLSKNTVKREQFYNLNISLKPIEGNIELFGNK
ncbi:MAG: chemoreceptor glutamine deamidase CheD [Alphaproteobacteria bacterium]